MASILSAGTTSATALNMSADTSGVLQLASNNGTTAITIGTNQVATFAQAPSLPAASIPQAALASNVVGNGPIFVSGSANFASINGNTLTPFTSFATSIIDTASCFNTSTGRFTPNVAGYYYVISTVTFGNNGVTSVLAAAQILKNGTATITAASVYSSGAYPTPQTSGFVYLNGSTDYVQVGTYIVGSGTPIALNVSAQLQAVLIRAA